MTQLTKSMLCSLLLMGGIPLTAQPNDALKGWARVRALQPQQQNARPSTAAAPFDLGKPWPPTSILGTWQLTGTLFGAPFQALITFLPSEMSDQGAVIFTSNQDQQAPLLATAESGNWTRTGAYTFVATHWGFLFDETNGTAVGVLKILDAITINGSQITVKSQLVFPADCGCGTFTVETTGSRVAIEAPPGN